MDIQLRSSAEAPRRVTKKKIAEDPTLCIRPHFHLSDNGAAKRGETSRNERRVLRVVEVPRALRADERKLLSREELASLPPVPKLKVGQEVTLIGVFDQRSPRGFRDTQGLLVYDKLITKKRQKTKSTR